MTHQPEKQRPHHPNKQTLMHNTPLVVNPLALVGEDTQAANARKAAIKQAKQTIAGGAMLLPLDPSLLIGQEAHHSAPSDTVNEALSPHEEAQISALFQDIFLEETPPLPNQRAALLGTRAWEQPTLQPTSSFLPPHEDTAHTHLADFAPIPPMINATTLDEPIPSHSSTASAAPHVSAFFVAPPPPSLNPAISPPPTLSVTPPPFDLLTPPSVKPPETHGISDASLKTPSPSQIANEAMWIAKRTTVLPEVDLRAGSPTLIQSNKDRYEFKKTLGEGAVGEVELARDNDIHRMVAIKRLKKSLHSPSTLLRFAEEIRTVGSLEHPNIIPIHDVGVDEEGRYYFVMKHIQGVTIEHIIERLQAGDAEYHAKYSFEYRARICMEILRAMQFAHSHGVIHRDLKPANIMVGPFGEVVVMDWGIAKRIRQTAPPNAQIQGFLDQLDHDIAQRLEADGGSRERLFQTRNDTLLGTPMYMSPEQALGHNDKLDERSDIYSLFVVFYEFLTLHHYLEGAASLEELLRGILQREPKNPLLNRHTTQPPIPADLHWFLLWGFQKDPTKRPQTIAEIIHRLQRIEDGYAHIQCPVTLNKRAATGFAHFINRHPVLSTLSTLFAATLMLGGCAFFVRLFLP